MADGREWYFMAGTHVVVVVVVVRGNTRRRLGVTHTVWQPTIMLASSRVNYWRYRADWLDHAFIHKASKSWSPRFSSYPGNYKRTDFNSPYNIAQGPILYNLQNSEKYKITQHCFNDNISSFNINSYNNTISFDNARNNNTAADEKPEIFVWLSLFEPWMRH